MTINYFNLYLNISINFSYHCFHAFFMYLLKSIIFIFFFFSLFLVNYKFIGYWTLKSLIINNAVNDLFIIVNYGPFGATVASNIQSMLRNNPLHRHKHKPTLSNTHSNSDTYRHIYIKKIEIEICIAAVDVFD